MNFSPTYSIKAQIPPNTNNALTAGGSKTNPAMAEKNFAVGETPSFANTENNITERN